MLDHFPRWIRFQPSCRWAAIRQVRRSDPLLVIKYKNKINIRSAVWPWGGGTRWHLPLNSSRLEMMVMGYAYACVYVCVRACVWQPMYAAVHKVDPSSPVADWWRLVTSWLAACCSKQRMGMHDNHVYRSDNLYFLLCSIFLTGENVHSRAPGDTFYPALLYRWELHHNFFKLTICSWDYFVSQSVLFFYWTVILKMFNETQKRMVWVLL